MIINGSAFQSVDGLQMSFQVLVQDPDMKCVHIELPLKVLFNKIRLKLSYLFSCFLSNTEQCHIAENI